LAHVLPSTFLERGVFIEDLVGPSRVHLKVELRWRSLNPPRLGPRSRGLGRRRCEAAGDNAPGNGVEGPIPRRFPLPRSRFAGLIPFRPKNP